MDEGLEKDAVLDRLAESANVAQFVSFAPGPEPAQRFSRLFGADPNHVFADLQTAITALLAVSPERSVNVRSFLPQIPRSREFLYGLTEPEEVERQVRRLAAEGLYTIINETIDVEDGGVSGVLLANVIEFAPGDTPRCVEKPGTAALPRDAGMRVLQAVYGFKPDIDYPLISRVEFSLHPLRRGWRHKHTVIWELEEVGTKTLDYVVRWPNHFSRFIGDKVFGLLVAYGLGLPVPRTVVVPREVAPFVFGEPTGTHEHWLRTSPDEQVPGRYPTYRGWRDPYELTAREDPEGAVLRSILAQDSVEAVWSGALITSAEDEPLVEGVRESGENFMQGRQEPEQLPAEVRSAVLKVYGEAVEAIGPVRMEWAFDGRRAWVLQMHAGKSATTKRSIFPGEAPTWHRVEVAMGLEPLRELVSSLEGSGEGVVLLGNVGITSHFADILRRARIPSRIEAQ